MGLLISIFLFMFSMYTAWLALFSMITLNLWGFIGWAFVTLVLWAVAAITVEM